MGLATAPRRRERGSGDVPAVGSGETGLPSARQALSPAHRAQGVITSKLPQHPPGCLQYLIKKGGWWIITIFTNSAMSPSSAGPSNNSTRSYHHGYYCFALPQDFESPVKEPTPRETTEKTSPKELTKGMRHSWEMDFRCLRPQDAPLMLGLSNAVSAGMDTSKGPHETPLVPPRAAADTSVQKNL